MAARDLQQEDDALTCLGQASRNGEPGDRWGALATAFVLSAPLVLWDWRAFVHSAGTVQKLAPFRTDALSYLVWMHNNRWRITPGVKNTSAKRSSASPSSALPPSFTNSAHRRSSSTRSLALTPTMYALSS